MLALGVISRHYFTGFGALFLALTVLLACLKTAIGLIVSNAQTFSEMFPNALSYNKWVVLFCCVSFGLANLGLSTIIKFSLPLLLTLYRAKMGHLVRRERAMARKQPAALPEEPSGAADRSFFPHAAGANRHARKMVQ